MIWKCEGNWIQRRHVGGVEQNVHPIARGRMKRRHECFYIMMGITWHCRYYSIDWATGNTHASNGYRARRIFFNFASVYCTLLYTPAVSNPFDDWLEDDARMINDNPCDTNHCWCIWPRTAWAYQKLMSSRRSTISMMHNHIYDEHIQAINDYQWFTFAFAFAFNMIMSHMMHRRTQMNG